jgi:hypothetical protein
MSVVTGVMLIVGALDWADSPLREVHDWVGDRRPGEQLLDVSNHAGGRKHPEFEAWAAGFNYFGEEEEFVSFVLSRQWIAPENLVLIISPQTGETKVHRPGPPWAMRDPPIVG